MEVDLGKIEQKRESSRRTAAQVHTAISFFYLLIIILIMLAMLTSWNSNGSSFIILPLIFSVPALIHYFAAKGLRDRKSWARPLSIVIGLFLLFGFPIGTICGIIILYQMLGKQWDNWESISSAE